MKADQRDHITRLHLLNTLFPLLTGEDLYLAKQIEHTINFASTGDPQAPGNEDHFNNALIQKVPSWVIVGGTEILSGSNGTNYYVDVQWGVPGAGSVTFKDKNTVRGTLNVTIEASSPPPSNSTDQNYIKNSTYRVPTTTGSVLNDEKIEFLHFS